MFPACVIVRIILPVKKKQPGNNSISNKIMGINIRLNTYSVVCLITHHFRETNKPIWTASRYFADKNPSMHKIILPCKKAGS